MPSLVAGVFDEYDVEFHSVQWFPDEGNELLTSSVWTAHPRNGPAKLGLSIQMWRYLLVTVRRTDVVHLNNLWNAVAVLPLHCVFLKVALLSCRQRCFAARRVANRAPKKATCMGDFSKAMPSGGCDGDCSKLRRAAAILRQVPGAKVQVIKNSIDIPKSNNIRCYESRPTRVIYLGRLHEHKGIGLLLMCGRVA